VVGKAYNNPRAPLTSEKGITVNGERQTFSPGMTLADLIASLNLEGDRIAVELDRQIVKRDQWGSTAIQPDSTIEIVQFVGGG
jgi:thiamine biosynthesis protein ThiS